MEEQRVVFREIPLHVVAGLVHPEAEAEDRRVDPGPGLRPDGLPISHAREDQRHEREIGAVVAIEDARQHLVDHRVGLGAAAPAREPGEGADGVALGELRDLVERLPDAFGEGRGRRPLPGDMADLGPDRAGGLEAARIEGDPEVAEVGGHPLGGADHEPVGAAGQGEGEVHMLARHEVALDHHLGGNVLRERPAEDQGHVAAHVGGAVEVHPVEGGLDGLGDLARRRGRDRDRDGGTGEVVGLDEIPRVALGQVVEEDEELVRPGLERQVEVRLGLQVAAIGGHPADLGAVEPQDPAAAGPEPEPRRPRRLRLQDHPRPGRDPGRAEPEAREVEPRRAEGQPPARGRERPPHVGPPVPMPLGEERPAGIFVGDEVLVLGEEEERVHLPPHGRVGRVEALLGERADLPVADGLPRPERLAQRGGLGLDGHRGHFSSLTATGATSLYSWFSPVMPQTKA